MALFRHAAAAMRVHAFDSSKNLLYTCCHKGGRMSEQERTRPAAGGHFFRGIFFLLLFISIVLAGALLKVMSKVFIVVTMSILLSFIFYPIVKKLNEKTRLPRPLIAFLMLLVLLTLIVFLGNLVVSSLVTIMSRYPKYESKFEVIYHAAMQTLGLPVDEQTSIWQNLWNQAGVRRFIQNTALSLSGNMLNFVKSLLMTLLFAFFLLSEMHRFKDKMDMILRDGSFGRRMNSRMRIVILRIIRQITQYVSIKSLSSLATGLLVFVTALISGMDFPIVWGFLAFILNFIPTFGSIASCGLTMLFALIQFYPSPVPVVLISVAVTLINVTIGNFIEPQIMGDNIDLSPFAILVSLSVWGWIWGFTGLLIAVPMFAIVKIVCENISFLRPLAILVGTGKSRKRRDEVQQVPGEVAVGVQGVSESSE